MPSYAETEMTAGGYCLAQTRSGRIQDIVL